MIEFFSWCIIHSLPYPKGGKCPQCGIKMTTPAPKTHGTGEYMSFLEQRIELVEQRYTKLLSRWADIQHWYETADRSAHSWAELDKIMENQDD